MSIPLQFASLYDGQEVFRLPADPIACWILARTSSLVTWPLYEMRPDSRRKCTSQRPSRAERPRVLTFSWWECGGSCLRHKPTELAHSFDAVLVSVSVFMALSTVFHSMNSADNFPLSHSVLPVSFLPYESFQLHISL